MATWEDGPEYAPIQQPDGFQVPEVEPLEQAPPRHHLSAGAPLARPDFSQQTPVHPLASLVPAPGDTRNPTEPFAVAASTVTAADSAWGAAHWSAPTGPPVVPAQNWGPPTSAPAGVPAALEHGSYPAAPAGPDPNAPIHLHDQYPPPGNDYPQPGTPQWFAPTGPPAGQGPARQAQLQLQGQPVPVIAKSLFTAVTPPLAIVLLIGTVIAPLAPILLWVGFGLSTRIRFATDKVRKVFIGTAIFWAVAGPMLGFVRQPSSISGWYDWVSGAGQFACIFALLGTAAVIYLESTGGDRSAAPPPPPRQPWG